MLVDHAVAIDHHTIDGDLIARAHHDMIADVEFGYVNLHFGSIDEAPCLARLLAEHLGQQLARFTR